MDLPVSVNGTPVAMAPILGKSISSLVEGVASPIP